MENYNKCLENIVLDSKDIVVFDVGCNISNHLDDFTELFLNKYPNSVCYAFDPLHWEKYEEKWKNDNRVILFKYALSSCIEKKEMYIPNQYTLNGLSSFYNRPYFNNQVTSNQVECVTIDFLFSKLELSKIHYLKIDTEGAEFDIIKGSENALKNKKIDYVQIEYGGTYQDAGYTLSNIQSYLNQFGYHMYVGPDNEHYGDIVFTHKIT